MGSAAVDIILLVNVGATLFMTGLIWFVQIIHYPLFAKVDINHFATYHSAHSAATTRLVVLPMLIEMCTSILLCWTPPAPQLIVECRVGLAMIILIWISTVVLQIPNHRTLSSSFDLVAHRALVLGNWVRSIAWSIRSVLMLYVLWQCIAPVSNNGVDR